MEVILVRHAVAEQRDPERWPDDSLRPLTKRGRQRMACIAESLRQANLMPDCVLSSGWARAWATAEILQQFAGWPAPTRCEAMELGNDVDVLRAIRAASSSGMVALVGHEPQLSELAALMLTGDDSGIAMPFKKGGMTCIRLDDRLRPGSGELRFVLPPRIAIAHATTRPLAGV